LTRKREEYIIVSLKLTKASGTCNRVSDAFFLMPAGFSGGGKLEEKKWQ
jgi:hypothetical protein